MKTVEIWERIYDNPLDEDGKPKPNKLLGVFTMIDLWIERMNAYGYTTYGAKGGVLYKIRGQEISYKNGGTKHHVTPLEKSEDVATYILYKDIITAI